MILIDYSGIAIATLFAQGSDPHNMQEGLIRHQILNTLRAYNVKFRKEYGQMILACDGGNTWRRQYFPEYKASRKINREESPVDWQEFYRILNLVRDEISEHIPFQVIHVQGCEADDVIAVLTETCQEFGSDKVMIVSSDKDFLQLQKYSNVKQFSPMKGKLLVSEDPIKELREKVLRGDSGDGIPNVLSSDKVFITEGARQTPVTAKKIANWLSNYDRLKDEMTPEIYRNFIRNQTLINLNQIPQEVQKTIIDNFKTTTPASKSKVLNYLVSKRCSTLVQSASEFFAE